MEKQTTWFPNRFDTNRPVQAQKMARGSNFGFRKNRNCATLVAKTKALITAKLIYAFVFAYADCWFMGRLINYMKAISYQDRHKPVCGVYAVF